MVPENADPSLLAYQVLVSREEQFVKGVREQIETLCQSQVREGERVEIQIRAEHGKDLMVSVRIVPSSVSVSSEVSQTPCMSPSEFQQFVRDAVCNDVTPEGGSVAAQVDHMSKCSRCKQLAIDENASKKIEVEVEESAGQNSRQPVVESD